MHLNESLAGLVKRQDCCCGASNCCGAIGGRVARSQDRTFDELASRLLAQQRPKLDALQAAAAQARGLNLTTAAFPDLARILDLVKEGEAWLVAYTDALHGAAQPSAIAAVASSTCLAPSAVASLVASVPQSVRITEASLLRERSVKADQVRRQVERWSHGTTSQGRPEDGGKEGGRPSLDQVKKCLEGAADCWPVAVNVAPLHAMLAAVDAWAAVACRELQIKVPRFEGRPPYLELATAALEPVVEIGFHFTEEAEQEVERKGSRQQAPAETSAKKASELMPSASLREEDTLHCLCRLPEAATEATMVRCDGCQGWFHLACVHETSGQLRAKGKAHKFVCPLCRDASGLPSTLACRPPPSSRKPGRFARTSLPRIRQLLGGTRSSANAVLPVVGVPAMDFLACLVDHADSWQASRLTSTLSLSWIAETPPLSRRVDACPMCALL
jgi:hypothetical protein